MRASPGFCNDGAKALLVKYILTNTKAVRDSAINLADFGMNAEPSADNAAGGAEAS